MLVDQLSPIMLQEHCDLLSREDPQTYLTDTLRRTTHYCSTVQRTSSVKQPIYVQKTHLTSEYKLQYITLSITFNSCAFLQATVYEYIIILTYTFKLAQLFL